nr:MAG TPA: hypothetical protein [Caudoviricetes sp.]
MAIYLFYCQNLTDLITSLFTIKNTPTRAITKNCQCFVEVVDLFIIGKTKCTFFQNEKYIF